MVVGADTTFGTVQYFIHAMLMYPEVQRKAQEEIDRVIGRDRLPTIEEYVGGFIAIFMIADFCSQHE